MTTRPGKLDAHLSRAETQIAEFALAFPEVKEENPWGHRAFKVQGKTFLFLGVDGEMLSLSTKLPESGAIALSLPFAEPTGYGLGKSGWVSAKFNAGDEVPLGVLRAWIDESFRAIAPKKIVTRLSVIPVAPPDLSEVPARKQTAARRTPTTTPRTAKKTTSKKTAIAAVRPAKKAAKRAVKPVKARTSKKTPTRVAALKRRA